MSCGKCLHHTFNLAFVLGLFVVAAVAVPTSVLVQNSEVTSNINAANNGHNLMTKVKRSSADVNGIMPKEAINDEVSTSANKKSSPEVLPPAFNVPTSHQHLENGGKASGDNNSNSIAYVQSAGTNSMPSNEDIINSAIAAGLTAAAVQAAATASQHELEQQQPWKQQAQVYGDETPSVLQKRGISNPQYLYGAMGLGGPYASASGSSSGNSVYGSGEYYNNAYLSNPMQVSSGAELETVPTGFWADEMDPSVVYTDIQDDDFLSAPRATSYRSKAYDNLQNILNAEAYPVQQTLHTSRYYGANNANKRANRYDNSNNGGASASSSSRLADMRLKRDTKLTPADMLALVALVEAGERARKEPETDTSNGYMYPSNGIATPPEAFNTYSGIKTYYPISAGAFDYPTNIDAIDNGGSWLEPNMVDYYGAPANVEAIPKYELQREQKYGGILPSGTGNRYGVKRFMVSKKKRSMGNFLNEPVSKPSIGYNVNSEKFY
ncbi:uncharacterized protein LOC120768191 [Bactrocera tryoni]|uniref:uncharacterized protein LOC120768191 n=1 Tax=Bactrocera tryoni TaxID=59916 RepID=UPI001A968FD4|nr:uncharacterized protein LOC120768191 [Bactrocera tryoni]